MHVTQILKDALNKKYQFLDKKMFEMRFYHINYLFFLGNIQVVVVCGH